MLIEVDQTRDVAHELVGQLVPTKHTLSATAAMRQRDRTDEWHARTNKRKCHRTDK